MIAKSKSNLRRWSLVGWMILFCLLAVSGLYLNSVVAQSQTTQVPTPPPVILGETAMPTATIIPELVPNPGQTDGIILGAILLILIIVIGAWVYGRNRKV